MAIIKIKNLSKSYRVYQKQEGVLAAIGGLFNRQVSGSTRCSKHRSGQVDEGEFVAFSRAKWSWQNHDAQITLGRHQSGFRTVARSWDFVPWERTNEYRRRFALVMGQKNQLWWDLPALESFSPASTHLRNRSCPSFEQTRNELSDMLDVSLGYSSSPYENCRSANV